jgi:hypothetical protein
MQLTNIARDVGEDARNGRLYLPRQWMREAGLDPDAWLAEPRFDAALAGVIERLLAEADRLYERAECGVASLPRDCRLGIQAARLVYGEIGQRLRQTGLDSVHRRAVVGRSRKLALIARASIATVFAPGHPLDLARDPDPQGAIRYLVDAAASDELPSRTFYQRTLRMLDLFERVGQRQRRPGLTVPTYLAWSEPMAASHPPSSAGQLLTRAAAALVYLAIAGLGLVYGYGFGLQIGGVLMGVVTAMTCALFCTILVSGALDQLGRWRRSGPDLIADARQLRLRCGSALEVPMPRRLTCFRGACWRR